MVQLIWNVEIKVKKLVYYLYMYMNFKGEKMEYLAFIVFGGAQLRKESPIQSLIIIYCLGLTKSRS